MSGGQWRAISRVWHSFNKCILQVAALPANSLISAHSLLVAGPTLVPSYSSKCWSHLCHFHTLWSQATNWRRYKKHNSHFICMLLAFVTVLAKQSYWRKQRVSHCMHMHKMAAFINSALLSNNIFIGCFSWIPIAFLVRQSDALMWLQITSIVHHMVNYVC